MSAYFFSPLDVWLFRDGKPFNAAGDHHAESVFPPAPSVLQGAIRTHYLGLHHARVDWANRADSIQALLGDASNYGPLRVRGPFLAKHDPVTDRAEVYLPRPTNLLFTSDRGEVFVTPQSWPETVKTSSRFARALWPPPNTGKPKQDQAEWFTLAELQKLFRRQAGQGVPSKALFTRETRPGIGLEPARRTVQEGLLYEAEFIRPQPNVGLVAEVSGYADWPERGTVLLGGEQHAAFYQPVNAVGLPPDPPRTLTGPFFVCFVTPAYFSGGWETGWGRFFDGPVDLQSAAFGRYVSLGGFDLSRPPGDARAHKDAFRYVPAGSVFFFAPKGALAKVRPDLIQNAFTESGAEIGFGQVIVQEWNP